MTDTVMTGPLRRQPLEALIRRRERTHDDEPTFDFSTPIDRRCWFVCPTLTPLYYTHVYRELNDEQQRRYNQLTALSFNELIAFFESTFASSVLVALTDTRTRRINGELADCLSGFIADERKHIGLWQRLNRLSEPELYTNTDRYILQISPVAQRILGAITARPYTFPLVFWIMLALEERSLDISVRTLQRHDEIEPRYRLIYREHLKDESRHVQLDWHLIERFYAERSRAVRAYNAKLFGRMIAKFFLPPTRAAARVIGCLVNQFPELNSLSSELIRQLKQVGNDPEYHEMMYSRRTTPITFQLLDQFEEMHALRHVLHSYTPNIDGTTSGTHQ